MCQLTVTYNKKKARALERGIGFTFTKEEFGEFLALKGTVNCFYTNQPFGAHGSATEATIERIDDMRPYGPDNCAWVTKAANHLKQAYIEKEVGDKQPPQDKITMFNSIKAVMTNRELFDQRAKKYSPLLTIVVISDHLIATEYANVSGNATRLGIAPDSFSVFKRLYTRKTCMISGMVFDAQNRECRLCKSTGKIIVVNTKVVKLVDEYINLFDTIDVAKLKALFK